MFNYTIDCCYHINSIPRTFDKAVKCELSVKWKVTRKEEINILKENATFELTQGPLNKTLIPARWVQTIKTNQNQKEIYKARGFETENKNIKERLLYELKKSLYGLKQSGRKWNDF